MKFGIYQRAAGFFIGMSAGAALVFIYGTLMPFRSVETCGATENLLEPWCKLFAWQTLTAGLLATLAAAATIYFLRQQIAFEKRKESERAEREEKYRRKLQEVTLAQIHTGLMIYARALMAGQSQTFGLGFTDAVELAAKMPLDRRLSEIFFEITRIATSFDEEIKRCLVLDPRSLQMPIVLENSRKTGALIAAFAPAFSVASCMFQNGGDYDPEKLFSLPLDGVRQLCKDNGFEFSEEFIPTSRRNWFGLPDIAMPSAAFANSAYNSYSTSYTL